MSNYNQILFILFALGASSPSIGTLKGSEKDPDMQLSLPFKLSVNSFTPSSNNSPSKTIEEISNIINRKSLNFQGATYKSFKLELPPTVNQSTFLNELALNKYYISSLSTSSKVNKHSSQSFSKATKNGTVVKNTQSSSNNSSTLQTCKIIFSDFNQKAKVTLTLE